METDKLIKTEPEYFGNRPRAVSTPQGYLPIDETNPKPDTTEPPDNAALFETPPEDSLTTEKKCTPKIQASFVLCCGFLCFGSSMAIIGPTVLELGCLTGEDVGQMSWVFFAQTCSALLGAIGSGIITDQYKINYNVFLAIVITLHAVALTILPFMRELGTLIIFTAMHGFFGGFQDTATNLRMIIMHGQDVPPYLQTLFFFYGLGAFISPIIAGNFLSEECNHGDSEGLGEFVFTRRRRHNGMGIPHWFHQRIKETEIMLTSNSSTRPDTSTALHSEIIRITSTRVHYAYIIVALIHVTVTVGLWYLFVIERKRIQDLSRSLEGSTSFSSDPLEDTASRSERSDIDPSIKTQVYCISFWIAIMVFISDGLQGSFGSYIYTYAVKSNIGVSVDDAAYLNSLFWGALALGRLLAIFISMYVTPRVMLLVDVTGCLLSIVLMFIFRFQIISLWIGTATFGLCLSNIFPTSVSMAESYFRLTGTITCFFVVCSGLGEMAIPLLIGKLFDIIGPISFLGVSCILCFISVGIFMAVVITGKSITQRQEELRNLSTRTSIEDLATIPSGSGFFDQILDSDENNGKITGTSSPKDGEEKISGTSSPNNRHKNIVEIHKKDS